MNCPRCNFAVIDAARFCPRCGYSFDETFGSGVPSGRPPKIRAGVPWAGILFLLGLAFGPAAVISGIYWGVPALLYAGIIVSAAIVIVVVLGFLF